MFAPGRINLQMIRQFQPCFSSALIAFIEANVTDDAERAGMTRSTPMTDTVDDWLRGAGRRVDESGWMEGERSRLRVDRGLPIGCVQWAHRTDPTR